MAIHDVQESFQELLAAEKVVNDRLASLREQIGESIRNVQMPGVTSIPGTVNCCVVSFSAIEKPITFVSVRSIIFKSPRQRP